MLTTCRGATQDLRQPLTDVRWLAAHELLYEGTGGEGAPRAGGADDEAERQAQQPAYVAHISVTETGIETEQGFRPIEPGMAVTAEIKTGQRRLIEYLLSPILRYRHDFGRER